MASKYEVHRFLVREFEFLSNNAVGRPVKLNVVGEILTRLNS